MSPSAAQLRRQLLVSSAPYLISVALGIAISALATWAYRHPEWRVEQLQFVGNDAHRTHDGARRALRHVLDESFLAVDLKQVKALVEDVPWVRQAKVQRHFPNGLTISIEEHQAMAWWKEAQGAQLVNAHGEIFEAQAEGEKASDWPVLSGPDLQVQAVVQAYHELAARLGSVQLGVHKLSLSPEGIWHATLNDSIELALGRSQTQDWLMQVEAMISTLPQLRQRFDQPLRSIDLRYSNGYAVALAGISVGRRQ